MTVRLIDTDTQIASDDILTASPGHGDRFTDHMVSSVWHAQGGGWSPLTLEPLADIRMHPATIGVHYAQVIFEGMKAHRQADGSIAVFRPERNAERFQRSAQRLAMPQLPVELFLDAVDRLVSADAGWLPQDPELSLYLRPLMFGTDVNLMLRPAHSYRFLLMAFVAGGFFGDTIEPISVWVDAEHSRAMVGGTGDVKCAANYGPSFVAQRRAAAEGCAQVLWLDAAQRRWVEELGGMNVFAVRSSGADHEVITPPLGGTILPGVTRDSLLTLARCAGFTVREQPIDYRELRDGCGSREITEMFACGTAAVVTPIGELRDAAGRQRVGDGQMGPVTSTLLTALRDAQRGLAPDPDGWLHHVQTPTSRFVIEPLAAPDKEQP